MDLNALPKRKTNRLRHFDYSSNALYFITFCTIEKRCLLSRVRFSDNVSVPCFIELTEIGKAVERSINAVSEHYSGVFIEKFVIMPNHVHLLIGITDPYCTSSIQTIIGNIKRYASIEAGRSIWQNGFYDHIIRTEKDHTAHRNYIEANPAKWVIDEYYRKA